jgi:hypothetical protein
VKDFPPYLWLAVGFVLLFWSCYAAWSDERRKAKEIEGHLLTYTPSFEFELGTLLWRYDPRYSLTLFFPIATILNRGHASITKGWNAVYQIAGATEAMQPLYLHTPYSLVVGDEELTITNDGLLNAKTSETPIERGCVANGRLLWALPGDRARQLQSLQFTMVVVCQDYLSNTYTAVYSPSPEPVSKLQVHPHEMVRMVAMPSMSVSDTPQIGPPEG